MFLFEFNYVWISIKILSSQWISIKNRLNCRYTCIKRFYILCNKPRTGTRYNFSHHYHFKKENLLHVNLLFKQSENFGVACGTSEKFETEKL